MATYSEVLEKLDYCWNLQETVGSTFSPLSGEISASLENTSKTIADITTDGPGAPGGPGGSLTKAIYLSGGDTINIDTDPIEGAGSVGLWYYQNTETLTYYTLFGHHSGNQKIRTQTGTSRSLSTRFVANGDTVVHDHSVFLYQGWHHLVWRRNEDNTVDFFVNGDLISENMFDGEVSGDIDFSRCGSNQSFADPIVGRVCQIFKTSQNLTNEDIAALSDGDSPKQVNEKTYTILACPDTQSYVTSDSINRGFKKIMSWTKSQIQDRGNPRNIVFLSHLGDVVNSGSTLDQFTRANEAMDTIDGVLPYSILPGNHDYNTTSNKSSGSNNYESNYGSSRFLGKDYDWYGGHDESDKNSYQIIMMDGIEVLHLALEWEPHNNIPARTPSPLDWAESIIQANIGKPTIISTHAYLTDSGAGLSIAGQAIADRLVDPYDQVFLVMNGHYHSAGGFNDGEYHQVRNNYFGNPVLEICSNYQDYSRGGSGYIRFIALDLINNNIEVETYSPAVNLYQVETKEDVGALASKFTVPMDFNRRFYGESIEPEPEPEPEDNVSLIQEANRIKFQELQYEIITNYGYFFNDEKFGKIVSISLNEVIKSWGNTPNPRNLDYLSKKYKKQ